MAEKKSKASRRAGDGASKTKRKKTNASLGAPHNAAAIEQEDKAATVLEDAPTEDFPVVGIGASAGGLEALEAFFRAMPSKPGVAFVVVVHLDTTYRSLLPDLLQRSTTLKVLQAANGLRVEPDHVYVIPPGQAMTIRRGLVELSAKMDVPTGLIVDTCLRSLAQDKGAMAAAIILSGMGSDGTLGIRAIKGEAGMVMAQDESAKYDGMPVSAINTGLVGYILAPAQMPEVLLQYLQRSSRLLNPVVAAAEQTKERTLQRILSIVRTRTGHDFSEYKTTTICRRIERRMSLHHLGDMERYLEYLQSARHEAETLFRELLIGVTSFFRDPEAFACLKPQLMGMELQRKSGHSV